MHQARSVSHPAHASRADAWGSIDAASGLLPVQGPQNQPLQSSPLLLAPAVASVESGKIADTRLYVV